MMAYLLPPAFLNLYVTKITGLLNIQIRHLPSLWLFRTPVDINGEKSILYLKHFDSFKVSKNTKKFTKTIKTPAGFEAIAYRSIVNTRTYCTTMLHVGNNFG